MDERAFALGRPPSAGTKDEKNRSQVSGHRSQVTSHKPETWDIEWEEGRNGTKDERTTALLGRRTKIKGHRSQASSSKF